MSERQEQQKSFDAEAEKSGYLSARMWFLTSDFRGLSPAGEKFTESVVHILRFVQGKVAET